MNPQFNNQINHNGYYGAYGYSMQSPMNPYTQAYFNSQYLNIQTNNSSCDDAQNLSLNARSFLPTKKKTENSNANKDAIAKYVEGNPEKFSIIVNHERYLKKGGTLKYPETKNAYYIKADKNLENTLKGLLDAIIPDLDKYPDGKNKKEVLDKYTQKLRGWCLGLMKPLPEDTFGKLWNEYISFAGKFYKYQFGEENKKSGCALNGHVKNFSYLPASNSSFKKNNKIIGIGNQAILLNSNTTKYEINKPGELKYKSDNILIESRAICDDNSEIYKFYENNLALIRLVVFYAYNNYDNDDNELPRVFISFDHYSKDGIVFEIRSRLG